MKLQRSFDGLPQADRLDQCVLRGSAGDRGSISSQDIPHEIQVADFALRDVGMERQAAITGNAERGNSISQEIVSKSSREARPETY
jgi:hypothetical protein